MSWQICGITSRKKSVGSSGQESKIRKQSCQIIHSTSIKFELHINKHYLRYIYIYLLCIWNTFILGAFIFICWIWLIYPNLAIHLPDFCKKKKNYWHTATPIYFCVLYDFFCATMELWSNNNKKLMTAVLIFQDALTKCQSGTGWHKH